jgi:hypothetical protein
MLGIQSGMKYAIGIENPEHSKKSVRTYKGFTHTDRKKSSIKSLNTKNNFIMFNVFNFAHSMVSPIGYSTIV